MKQIFIVAIMLIAPISITAVHGQIIDYESLLNEDGTVNMAKGCKLLLEMTEADDTIANNLDRVRMCAPYLNNETLAEFGVAIR